MSVETVALAAHDLLAELEVPHAFGGALALNYYANPRATLDVDLNVFVPFKQAVAIIDAFAPLAYVLDRPLDQLLPVSGARLQRGADRIALDLFFSLGSTYETVAARVVEQPFGRADRTLPFLSAEDLVMFKLSFNRDKDWVDIRQIIRHGTPLDVDYIEQALVEMRGPTMYPRVARLRSLIAAA